MACCCGALNLEPDNDEDDGDGDGDGTRFTFERELVVLSIRIDAAEPSRVSLARCVPALSVTREGLANGADTGIDAGRA